MRLPPALDAAPLLSIALGALLAACGSSHDRADRSDGGGGDPDAAIGDAGAARDAGPGPGVDGGPRSCGGFAEERCADDEWCDHPEGSFCGGDDSPGICRPRPTACPFLYDPVCGCDGTTYGNECAAQAAGVDVSSRGECEGSTGTVCTNASPCVGGGICTGSTCGEAWRCVDAGIACTDDEAPFCGCDGVTFHGSSTCPTQPFMFGAACEDGVSCDARTVDCATAMPRCPAGQVASVSGGCWGRCVDIGFCRCASAGDCPEPDRYTCHGTTDRCGPPVGG